jgi:hypothetical protein
MVELWNVSLLELRPSNCITWLTKMLPSEIDRGGGGTTGVNGFSSNRGAGGLLWAKAKDCRTVETWGLPKPKKDAQSTPSTNDPNATVMFRITPPSSGSAGNCTVWKYHEGEAPKPQRIIRPKKSAGKI